MNLAYKFNNNNSITFNLLYNNDAEITARNQFGGFTGQVSDTRAVFNVNSMEFIQRQSITPQLFTKHVFPKLNNAELQLGGSYTASKQDEPNLRYFAYSTVIDSVNVFDEMGNTIGARLDTNYSIQNSEYQYPFEFVRNLEDKQYQAKVDFTLPLGSSGINKLKVGGYYSSLNRNFEEYRFQLTPSPGLPQDVGFTAYDGDLEGFFANENMGIIDTTFRTNGSVQRYVPGYYYVNNTIDRNFYTGSQSISAGYVMGIFNLTQDFKVVGGLRTEYTNMQAVSRDTSLPTANIKLLDFLPSLNFIYALNDRMNIRLSGSRTIVRPNLREIAPFEQLDTKNGFFLLGNPNLERTSIWNADLRWEFFPRSGEMLAISYYYKQFNNPIFKQYNPAATIPELQFINVESAFITGAEIEFRKSFDFITPKLADLSMGANFSYIYSRYNIPENEVGNSLFIDSTYEQTTRPFQGQAPYIVNFILAYDNSKIGLESALYFNVSGNRLYNIALFATPDIYENARPTLNYKISKTFGKYFSVSFAARNLINPEHNRIQTHRGQDFYAERYRLGRTFVVGLGFKF
jgi:TonB-dependent receptor